MTHQISKRALSAGLGIGALALLAQTKSSSADTSFTTFAFPATGTPTPRTMPDRLADLFNVKDFGAVGDGKTDDTSAIQSALDAAYGSSSNSHGINYYANKAVFFPPGHYITTSPLTLTDVQGAWIFGSGRFTTKIEKTSASGGNDGVISTDHVSYSVFERICFKGNSGGSLIYQSDSSSGSTPKTQSNSFRDIEFDGTGGGAPVGIQLGDAATSQVSETLFSNCFWQSFTYAGMAIKTGNALQITVIGGNFQSCNYGIYCNAGAANVVSGCGFQANTNDIYVNGATSNTMVITGCRTESSNFVYNGSGRTMEIVGCHQTTPGTRGYFYEGYGGFVDIRGCMFNGQIYPKGWTRLHITACSINEQSASDFLVLTPSQLWYTPNNTIAALIELADIVPYITPSSSFDTPILRQRMFTTDGSTITTQTYNVS